MTESKAPSETAKPIGRWAGFWRKAGQALRALVGAKTGLVIFLAVTLGCAKGEVSQNIGEFLGGFFGAKPTPVEPAPTVTPTRPPVITEPTPTPTIEPTATPVPTATPGPVFTATPPVTPAPVLGCVPKPDDEPVTIAYRGRCPSYMRRMPDLDPLLPTAGMVACGGDWGSGNHHVATRLELGTARDPNRFPLILIRGAVVQFEDNAGRIKCIDAIGRTFENCDRPYPHGTYSDIWATNGYAFPPLFCDQAPTPTVPPTPTFPPSVGCAAVEALEHFMAPGNHCHAWHPDGGQIACLVDSTIRPICDTDHMENWTTFCGGRTHDPDFNDPEQAMVWMISGAEDRGPSPANSAQRWIRGNPGAEVSVMVCIRPDARTPDGCRITRRGDGCGVRVFTLPGRE